MTFTIIDQALPWTPCFHLPSFRHKNMEFTNIYHHFLFTIIYHHLGISQKNDIYPKKTYSIPIYPPKKPAPRQPAATFTQRHLLFSDHLPTLLLDEETMEHWAKPRGPPGCAEVDGGYDMISPSLEIHGIRMDMYRIYILWCKWLVV